MCPALSGLDRGRREASTVIGPVQNQTTKRSQSLRKPGGRVAAPSRFRRRVRSPTAQHPVPATTATGIPAGRPVESQGLPTYIRRSDAGFTGVVHRLPCASVDRVSSAKRSLVTRMLFASVFNAILVFIVRKPGAPENLDRSSTPGLKARDSRSALVGRCQL
jgi:hypothetical protein